MDILENGAGRPPMRRRTRVALLAVLVVAVLTAVALGREAGPPAASPVLPSVPTPVVAALVDTGGGTMYRGEEATKEFVLSVELINFNRVPARVAGGPAPELPVFDRLAVAVLPEAPDDATVETVTAAARTAVTIAGRAEAQLVIAGRVVCGVAPASPDDFTILVDGEERRIEMPRFGGDSWVAEVVAHLCPAR